MARYRPGKGAAAALVVVGNLSQARVPFAGPITGAKQEEINRLASSLWRTKSPFLAVVAPMTRRALAQACVFARETLQNRGLSHNLRHG
jgi:hypothetical protein